jgi:hypothetical protein
VREIRRKLVPYLKDARKRGHRAFFKKDKLMVTSRLYGVEEVEERIKLSTGNGNVDNPEEEMRPLKEYASKFQRVVFLPASQSVRESQRIQH